MAQDTPSGASVRVDDIGMDQVDAAGTERMPTLYLAGIRIMHDVMFMSVYQNLGSGICGKNQHTMAISVTKKTTMHPTIKPCRFCSRVVNGGALVGLTGARPSRGFPSDEYFIGTILCPISGFSIMHCGKV
uniref:hypothetical protein n=1 Tax=Komagataeibacter xylinus TaxID=28448 RepID=UPI0011DD4669|nr:hypothetical protein [Komagataeibacter xylinus]